MIPLRVLKVSQPIGEFYIGAMKPADLLAISKADVRRFDENDPETIDGIQRELSKSRVNALRQYVNLEYATFPTSVILAVDHRCVRLEPIQDCTGLYDLRIEEYDGSDDEDDSPIRLDATAFVIDGQHRLAGLENRDNNQGPFEINVSIFVGADRADQAEIFTRINLGQTKVNKSLAYDLLDYAKENSPFKVAHDVVVALNSDEQGPFFRKIKRLGVQTPGVEGETLAQATVVNGLLRHLPSNQEIERSKSRLGLFRKPEPGESWKNRIFVDFYRSDDLVSIFLTVSNYFDAVRERWPQAWEEPSEGQILVRTTGFNALIRFLKDVYLNLVVDVPRVVKKEEFDKIFRCIPIDEQNLTRDNYVPGSSGQGQLYSELKEGSGSVWIKS